jgi:hypothetical protein
MRKRVQCPACRHWVRVRPDQPASSARSSDAQSAGEPGQDGVVAAQPFWEGMTNKEILEYARATAKGPLEWRKREAQRFISLSCAQYDDLTLFTLSLALLLLLALNVDLQRGFFLAIATPDIGVFVGMAGLGMILSFANIFWARDKSDTEKRLMLLFAVLATAGTGVGAGAVVLKDSPRWLMIFPAWNILSGAMPTLELCTGLITIDSVTDERPTLAQFLVTTVSTVLLLLLCQYAFKLHWAIGFSVTVCYALSLQGVIREYFPTTRDVSLEKL